MSYDLTHANASWRLRFIGIAILAVAIAIALIGIFNRINHDKALKQVAEEQDVTLVSVFTPENGPSQQSLILPGSVAAYNDAPIYARVGGYLKSWDTDIGAHVKAGQLLGTIETPELDQQIHKAEAELLMAQANSELAGTTVKRWQNLLVTDSVSHQETDEKAGDAKAKQAIVEALRANLDGLKAQQAFNRVLAPFDGVVTDRKTDIGMLINPGSSGTGQALFRVAKIDKLRVYVEVPQNYSEFIKPGLTAELHFPEHPSRIFTAKLVSTSNAIHQDSRTLTVELEMDNSLGEILPGTYAEVHFVLSTKTNVFRLPTSALLFRKNGMEVAVVGAENTVVLKPITIGRDLGTMIEVVSGLDSSDKVIDSPSDSISDGDKVRIATKEVTTNTNDQHARIKG